MDLLKLTNMSLDLIDAKNITSLDDDSHTAKTCKTWAYETFYELGRSYRWNFQKKYISLTVDPIQTSNRNTWTLPADYLQLWDELNFDYEVLQNKIFANNSVNSSPPSNGTISFSYISNDETLLSFAPSTYTEFFTHKLASKLATILVRDINLSAALEERSIRASHTAFFLMTLNVNQVDSAKHTAEYLIHGKGEYNVIHLDISKYL